MFEHNERFFQDHSDERRSLRRVRPTSKVWAAVENTSRNEMLGMAEVSDFSGLGIALRNIAGDPVAAVGDRFCVTLVAEEGIIPLSGTLVHLNRTGTLGLRIDPPTPPGEQFLIRVYQRVTSPALMAD